MAESEAFFWVFMCLGATLSALAITYRLGHTAGYRQAEKLTLPHFEIIERFTPISTDIILDDEEAAVMDWPRKSIASSLTT